MSSSFLPARSPAKRREMDLAPAFSCVETVESIDIGDIGDIRESRLTVPASYELVSRR